MKKIVLIYMNSMAPAGGIERVVANLFNELVNEIEVILVTKDNKESFYKLDKKISSQTLNNYLELNLNKSRLSRINSIIKNILLGNLKLRKKIKEINPDYIYVVSPLEALEVLIAKTKYQKLLISEHGSKFGYNKIYNFIKKIVYPKAYKLVVPSTMDTELYIKDGYPAVYIPHLNTFKNNRQNKLEEKVVLNIGRYTDDKQQDVLINIWYELCKTNSINNWKLHIVGKGENEEKLRKKIQQYELEDSVKLLPPKQNVEEYFKEASIFAFTSRYEGFGMVLLEAMSFGIPCISFDCPSGPRDIVKNNQNGYLIKNNEKEEFKEELSKLINDKSKLHDFGIQAYKFSNSWNNNEVKEQWLKIIKEG